MTVWHAMRRRTAWVLGAFLIAQVTGVVPLLSLHAGEIFVHASNAADRVDDADHRHHQGDAGHAGDRNGDCCAVHHHLAGILSPDLQAVMVEFAPPPMIAHAAVLAESASPNLPDRPPKLLRSI